MEGLWANRYPSKCRGDWGWSFGFVPIPLVRGDCVGFVPIPLLRGWPCVALCLTSCVEVVVVWERSCILQVCITQILSGGSLCGKSYVDVVVKILLCEGGKVKQCLKPQNISLCLWLIHYLLTLSLFYLALIHIAHFLHAWYCLCFSLVLNQESFI